jgi:mono/diheme cytochrome c family protein
MKNLNIFKSFPIIFSALSGVLWIFLGSAVANETQINLNSELLSKPENQGVFILAQGRGHMGGCGRENRNDSEDCTRRGMNHRRGMGHGMRHGMGRGPGLDGEAQCPQTRSTTKAPEELYNKTNPIENTADNIEKGRLLFQLDAQPTCTVCHGSGNGLGMMSGGLNPPPRNFTCKETMESISDGQLFWIIKNGSPGTGMSSFENLNDQEIWQLVHFIRQLAE